MKKIFTLTLTVASALALYAGSDSNVLFPGQKLKAPTARELVKKDATIKKAPAFPVESEEAAYYPAPAGVYYLGLTIKNEKPSEAAVAPCNADITFSCPLDIDENDYEWTYIAPNGKELEAENKDIVMNVDKVSLVDAPFLFAQGYWGNGTYNMARAGIIFGQGYYGDGLDISYPSNQNTRFLKGEFFNPATLSVNYEPAGENFAKNYPLKLTDVTVKGFGELFRYAAPYSFDVLRANVVYYDATAEAGDLIAEIYPYSDESGVDFDNLLGTYVIFQAYPYDVYEGCNFYGMDFKPANDATAPVITSDVMVIFRSGADCTKWISPSEAGIESNFDGEPATNFVYASYTRNGTAVEDGCLNYSGVEFESRYPTYLYHWSVSGKMNFDVKTDGIDDLQIATADENEDAPVYNMMGVKVGTKSTVNTLPAGLYISNRQKILVK